METVTSILRVIVRFLPFIVRLLPAKFKPAGPIEPLKTGPWATPKK